MTSEAAILIVGDSAMLSREQLQQISTSIDDALKVSSSEPCGLVRYLLAMASMEVAQRIKSQPELVPKGRLEQSQTAAARPAMRVA
jgi:hypothetical protein